MHIYVYIRNQNTKTPKHFFQSPARRTIFGAGFLANHPGELELPAAAGVCTCSTPKPAPTGHLPPTP